MICASVAQVHLKCYCDMENVKEVKFWRQTFEPGPAISALEFSEGSVSTPVLFFLGGGGSGANVCQFICRRNILK